MQHAALSKAATKHGRCPLSQQIELLARLIVIDTMPDQSMNFNQVVAKVGSSARIKCLFDAINMLNFSST